MVRVFARGEEEGSVVVANSELLDSAFELIRMFSANAALAEEAGLVADGAVLQA